MSGQRLFFGLQVPAGHHLALQDAVRLCALPDAARPVPAVNFHLTLAFLGNVAEHRLPCVRRAAQRIDTRRFPLRIDHLGYWSRPRILWAAPSRVPAGLNALVNVLQRRLMSCGFEAEQRPYRPHLTLARKVGGYSGNTTLNGIDWWVEEFHLYHSSPSRDGVRYRVLASWPLASGHTQRQLPSRAK